MHEYNSPLECCEPETCVSVWLIFSYDYWVRDREQSNLRELVVVRGGNVVGVRGGDWRVLGDGRGENEGIGVRGEEREKGRK